jgi:hypothetical protein
VAVAILDRRLLAGRQRHGHLCFGVRLEQTSFSKSLSVRIRDRCYDFLNIYAKNFSKKLASQNKAKLCKNLIITVLFGKNAIFSPKIVENRRKL